MTDTLTPGPVIRDAIIDLKDASEGESRIVSFNSEAAKSLLAALPADLVAAATAEMPEEPGLYVGPGGTHGSVWRVTEPYGDMFLAGHPDDTATPADGPFRRLVVESDGPTPVFTAGELRRAWLGHGVGGINHGGPEWDRLADFVNKTISKEADR